MNMRSSVASTLSAFLCCSLAAGEQVHASFQSTRGVQHKAPVISDDLVVGCIMVMFLLLFAFGAADTLPLQLPWSEAVVTVYREVPEAEDDELRERFVVVLKPQD